MSRLGSLALVVLVLGGFALYVFETQPRWYERLRYPLRTSRSSRVTPTTTTSTHSSSPR